MFRSSIIIREIALNLAKSYICVKTFGVFTSLLLCSCVAASHGMTCVLYAVQNATAVA